MKNNNTGQLPHRQENGSCSKGQGNDRNYRKNSLQQGMSQVEHAKRVEWLKGLPDNMVSIPPYWVAVNATIYPVINKKVVWGNPISSRIESTTKKTRINNRGAIIIPEAKIPAGKYMVMLTLASYYEVELMGKKSRGGKPLSNPGRNGEFTQNFMRVGKKHYYIGTVPVSNDSENMMFYLILIPLKSTTLEDGEELVPARMKKGQGFRDESVKPKSPFKKLGEGKPTDEKNTPKPKAKAEGDNPSHAEPEKTDVSAEPPKPIGETPSTPSKPRRRSRGKNAKTEAHPPTHKEDPGKKLSKKELRARRKKGNGKKEGPDVDEMDPLFMKAKKEWDQENESPQNQGELEKKIAELEKQIKQDRKKTKGNNGNGKNGNDKGNNSKGVSSWDVKSKVIKKGYVVIPSVGDLFSRSVATK